MLRLGLRIHVALLIWVTANNSIAAIAESPITGGLGIQFDKVVPISDIGAEVMSVPESALPSNVSIKLPDIEPGGRYPWRRYSGANLPRPFRSYDSESYIMVNDAGEPIRVIARIQTDKCMEHFDWLKATLGKKYDVQGDPEQKANPPNLRALRIEFLAKQIDVRCGPSIVIEYLDGNRLEAWARSQQKRYATYQREQSKINQRRVLLKRHQAISFADTFTLGDRFRLEGAFGIQFRTPFAKNSTQQFPIDQPFYAVLPNLPKPFAKGEIQMVISPEKHPIVIRGTFHNLVFEDIADALKSKYGSPFKASSRHIIHKISGNHAIVKRMAANTIELAFIDTDAKAEQRERLWAQESEGL